MNARKVALAGRDDGRGGRPCCLLFAGAAHSSPASFGCPPADEAGFALGESYTSTDPILCSYPAFPGESPTDFHCTYNASTGALVTDNDLGLCPASAVAGTSKASPSIGTSQDPALATAGSSIADKATVTRVAGRPVSIVAASTTARQANEADRHVIEGAAGDAGRGDRLDCVAGGDRRAREFRVWESGVGPHLDQAFELAQRQC